MAGRLARGTVLAARASARGAALLLVLWLVALLSALAAVYALTSRVEALQGRVLADRGAGQEIARAGLEYALLRLGDPDPQRRWRPDGRQYRWQFDGVPVEIRIVDETGKVDLNLADMPLLSRLMQALGATPASADALAAAIADWRDPDPLTQPSGGAEDPEYAAAGLPYGAKDAPFETLSELSQVLGMPPDLYRRLRPLVSLHAGRSQPDPGYAPAPVLAALGLDPAPILAQRASADPAADALRFMGRGSGTYSIESRAGLARGGEASLQAVVRASARDVPGSVYTALHWQEGASPP